MARLADLVVVGVIRDAGIGPSIKTAPNVTEDNRHGLLETFILDVEVHEVLRGARAHLLNGHVYLEIPRGVTTEAELDSDLPISQVLLFLDDLSDAKRPFGVVKGDERYAGIPRTFAPFPQGFIFEMTNGVPLGVEDLGSMSEAWSAKKSFDQIINEIRDPQ